MKDGEENAEYQAMRQQLELFRLIFNNLPSGAMVTDGEGIVTHLNEPYADFLGIDLKKSIGRHCTEVVENTRMHVVGKTGVPEINQVQMIRGQNIVVHRIPINKEGRVIAVFGLVMFQDIGEVVKLSRVLHSLESKVRCYEKELMNLRSTRYTLESIVGESPVLGYLKQQAGIAAGNISPVLTTGESGTGKGVFAQAIHHAGPRKLPPLHPYQLCGHPALAVAENGRGGKSIRELQAETEKEAIVAALRQTGNNKAGAAALLGIHRTLLYRKMKKHGLALQDGGAV